MVAGLGVPIFRVFTVDPSCKMDLDLWDCFAVLYFCSADLDHIGLIAEHCFRNLCVKNDQLCYKCFIYTPQKRRVTFI